MTLQQIKEYKQQLGYTNELLSELSGVPLSTVQKVLGGVTKNPRQKTLMALSKAFPDAPASPVPSSAPGAGPGPVYPQALPTGASPSAPTVPASRLPKVSFGNDGNYGKNGNEKLSDHWYTDSDGFSIVREASVAYGTHKKKYTMADLDALPDGVLAELMDGNLYFMCAPSTFHQEIAGELYLAVASYIRAHNGKCKVYIPPFSVNLFADDTTCVLPDLTVICDTSRINRRGCHGAPDWVVEILSPSTTRKDCGQKLYKYRRAGVKEYWIVYPDKRMVTVYLFAEEEADECVTIYSFEDSIPCSLFPDLRIRLADYL